MEPAAPLSLFFISKSSAASPRPGGKPKSRQSRKKRSDSYPGLKCSFNQQSQTFT